MILKLQGCGVDDWWVYGEIRKIHYERIERSDDKCEETPDLYLFRGAPSKCLRIILRFVDGSEYSILKDSIGYLCNDCGETIEKIVV